MTDSIIQAERNKERSLPYIIAVDFDGTLVENKFPEIGEIREAMWGAVVRAQEQGAKLILWTCRTEERLDEAIQFCKDNGLIFDAVNDNIEETKALGWHARKAFANMYIDDRSAVLDLNIGFVPVKLEVDPLGN